MIKKVVFFIGNCFSENDMKRFGFEVIINRGYKVEAWDFTPWINYDYYMKHKSNFTLNIDNYRTMYNNYQIKSAISKLSSSDIIIDTKLLSKKKKIIFENLKFKKIKIVSIILGLRLKNKLSLINKVKYYFIFILNDPFKFFIKIYDIIYSIISSLIKIKKSYNLIDLLIVGGSGWRSDDKIFFNDNVTLIKAHAFDYDRYIEENNKDAINNKKKNYNFSVFLDEDMPFHPDYEYLNIKPYCLPKNYYNEINNFFDDYENKTGYEIIIAACPRTDYKLKDNPYNKRKIISNNSISLVKKSKHVLTHMSTAVNFAILYKKPIIFINSNNFSFIAKRCIENLSSFIGNKYINIDQKLPSNYNKISINEKQYRLYKEKYIKEPNTPERCTWDIFCDYLDKINKYN